MNILPQLLVNALITGSIYALSAAALALSYNLLRALNFAHGHFMMLGAYLLYWVAISHDASLPVIIVAMLLGMVFLGLLSLTIFIRPFLRFNALLPFVTTLALATILESLVSITFGVNVKSFSRWDLGESIEFSGIFITPLQIGIVVIALIIMFSLAMVIHCTGFGRRIRALAEAPWVAEGMGINSKRTQAIVFCVSSILAGLAGIMVGLETNIQPTMGGTYTIKAFAAMTLGGLGSIWGTVVGSYLLGLTENLVVGLEFGGFSVPAGYKDAVAFLAILLVLLVRPQGLFSASRREV